MKKSLAVLILILFFLISFSSVPGAETSKAVITERIHDFGEIERGREYDHIFVIENKRDQPLKVINVQPMCGCTVTHYDRDIPSGGRGRISATIDISDLQGRFSKEIKVTTNDPSNRLITLVLKGKVKELIEVVDGNRVMLVGCAESRPSIIKTIISHLPEPLKIENISSTLPPNTLSYKLTELEEGKKFTLELTNISHDIGGRYSGKIELITNNPRAETVTVLVRLHTFPQVRVAPAEVVFNPGGNQQRKAKEVTISFCAETFNIGNLYYDKDLFSVNVRKASRPHSYTLSIFPNIDELPSGKNEYPLLIETNVPKNKYLLVKLVLSLRKNLR